MQRTGSEAEECGSGVVVWAGGAVKTRVLAREGWRRQRCLLVVVVAEE